MEESNSAECRTDLRYMNYYQKLYGEAYIDLCEQALKRMKQAHGRNPQTYRGSIVGISAPGMTPISGKLIDGYDIPGSGKAIMEHATRYYALNVAPYNVNVNTVVPGYTRSDAWNKVVELQGGKGTTEEFLQTAARASVPLGTFLEATDVGDWIVFLATSSGGRFMTGQSLVIDGGMHLK